MCFTIHTVNLGVYWEQAHTYIYTRQVKQLYNNGFNIKKNSLFFAFDGKKKDFKLH